MFKINKTLIFIVLCWLPALTLKAQQTTSPVTLKQLLTRVDKNAPALITDSSAIRIRQAQAVEVRNNWLPNLKLNYQADIGTSNNVTGPYFGYGIIPSSSGGIHPNNVTTALSTNLGIASFDWEVYNFGYYGAQNRVAQSDIKVEQNNFAQSKYTLEAFTINNYLLLMSLQDYLNIQARNIQRTQDILRSVTSLTKSGVRPGVDTSIANAELSKARLNYIELHNQLQQVQLQLAEVSGLPYQSIVADTLVAEQLIHSPYTPFNMDTAGHPLINYYQSLYQNSKEQEGVVKNQYNPKIFIQGAAWGRGSSVDPEGNYNSLSTGWGFQRDNYLVGVGVSYNLFDLRRQHLKLNTQRAESDYYRNKLEEQKQLLASGANQANALMQTALQRLQEIPNQLRAANAGYRQKLSLYKNGLTDIVDLDAALSILYRAETDYVQARYDYTTALFNQAITDNQVNTILNTLK
ncbi:MAG TPA: TolC family protein [Mucilaginibacter sp.]|jgi:outer membrane protein TolC|nr:TolC family protein [Mucilaginibacter sp.]